MGSLFGMNFEKEGKGVPEDGSREMAFFRFFKIIKRKFWEMIRINMMQVICSLPAFVIGAFILSYMYFGFLQNEVEYDLAFRIITGFMIVSMQLVTIGPLHAGFIYTMRNYAREENVFVWSDFIKGIRENWKRAAIVSIIEMAVMFICSYMYMFYNVKADELGMISEVCKVITIILVIIYAMMHIYIYPMMVTLDLNIRQIYGNALRFAIAKFIPNIAIIGVIVILDLIIFVNIIAGLFIILLAGYSLTGFLSTFYAYGAIDKYIIQKIKT
ncbi:MAG: DUF624 domain-containing protein [Eubacteriales bacterium]|nr:DUF624 domain-containing protein [Eubacteriales bacterium]